MDNQTQKPPELAPPPVEQPKSGIIAGTMKWAWAHPKTSLLVGAGVTLAAGAEVLAAALFGGAVAAVIGIGHKPKE